MKSQQQQHSLSGAPKISGESENFETPALPVSGASVNHEKLASALRLSRAHRRSGSSAGSACKRMLSLGGDSDASLPELPETPREFGVDDTVMYPCYYNGYERHARLKDYGQEPYFYWAKAVVERENKNGTVTLRLAGDETLKVKKRHIRKVNDEDYKAHLKPEELNTYLGMYAGDDNAHLWRYNDQVEYPGKKPEYVFPKYNYTAEESDFKLQRLTGCGTMKLKADSEENILAYSANEFIKNNWMIRKEFRRYFPAGGVLGLAGKPMMVSENPANQKMTKKELKRWEKEQRMIEKKKPLTLKSAVAKFRQQKVDAALMRSNMGNTANTFRRLAGIESTGSASTTFTVGCILAAGLIGYFARRFFCKRRPTERKDEHCL